ncbi:MAG: SpoIIE family protein phosphatase [Chlamydiota bacterium]
MTDSKISKKPHFSASLAWRILTVSIFLLVIPLFLQSLFLYNQEYRKTLEDVKANLEILAKERVLSLEEMIRFQWSLLDRIDGTEVFVKKLNIEKITPPPNGDAHFVLVSTKRQALLIGKKESATIALAIPIPFSQLIHDFFQAEDSPYPIRLALIEAEGTLIAENMKVRGTSGLLSVQEPIGNTNLHLQLTIPKDLIEALHQKNYYFRFGTLFLFVGVLGGGAVYLLTRRIARPLSALGKTLEKVREGALHARYTSDWMGFEINELGLQFNATLDAMLQHKDAAEKERIEREKLAEEMRIGHDIQASLFPTHLPDLKGIDFAPGYLPAKEVNGDFYDFFLLENGKVLIAMADVAGKGISACLYSLGLRSMLRSLASQNLELSEIVIRTNDLFWLDARSSSMFATLWLGLYDPKTDRMNFCSQGHPPALLRRGGEIQELWTGGIALGAQKFDTVPTKEISLFPGDLLLLYTDGIIEAHNENDQLFGQKRLHKFLKSEKKYSSEEIAKRLWSAVAKFSGSAPQHDDMTLLVLQILEQPSVPKTISETD